MVTSSGVKLIEYNARFGDPEAINLLTLLDGDFSEICYNITQGTLGTVEFRNESSVCKYIVPEGYGSNPRKDATLIINPDYARTSSLYYAAVNQIDNQITTTSSRAVALVSSSSTIAKAEEKCESGLKFISGDNLYVRHDIAKEGLIKKRIKNMEKIR